MSTSPDEIPSREDAARYAAEAAENCYIVIPASPWGGRKATFGPMTEAEARERLGVYLPLYVPECPPKLLRLVEDYAIPARPVLAGKDGKR
jgi:hypothetical protein